MEKAYNKTKEIGRKALDTTSHEIDLINATLDARMAITAGLLVLGTSLSGFEAKISKSLVEPTKNLPIPTNVKDFITNKNNVYPRNMAEQIPVLKDMPQGVKDFYQGSLGNYGQSAGSSSVMFQVPVPPALKAVVALIPPAIATTKEINYTAPPSNILDFTKIDTSDPIKDKNDVAAYGAGYVTATGIELALRQLAKKRLDKRKIDEEE